MTDRALKLLFNEIDKLSTVDEVKIKILEQSILNNWKSVYELKQKRQEEKSIYQDRNNYEVGD